jgi:AcrR family transcriptional regulator
LNQRTDIDSFYNFDMTSKNTRRAPGLPDLEPAASDAFTALRRQPSQARGAQRVADVLDACERLLKNQRFEQIKIEEIAREANIRLGSLYHFFPDKTSILLSILERTMWVESAAFRPMRGDEELSFDDYLNVLERRMLEVWRPRLALLDLYFAFQRHPLVWAAVLKSRVRIGEDVGAKLRQLNPSLTKQHSRQIGSLIGVTMATLMDNIVDLKPAARRVLRRECFIMLNAYVNASRG